MPVDHLDRGHTAAAIPVAADAGIRLDSHDDLPEIGTPAAQLLAVIGVDGANGR